MSPKQSARFSAPEIKDQPGIAELRRELEKFLDVQREGYARLYDAKAGQFYFGWDATKDRLFGWADLARKMDDRPRGLPGQRIPRPGHVHRRTVRAPARCDQESGLQDEAVPDAGRAGNLRLGSLGGLGVPGPGARAIDDGAGAAKLAEAPGGRRRRRDRLRSETGLPGFLSESYSGEGVQYTGSIGIPEITVSPRPRITDAASLYTLGAAYSVAPEKIEQFLAANWSVVSEAAHRSRAVGGLATRPRHEVIQFQTSAHTFSLILGFLGTASEHMKRYLDSNGPWREAGGGLPARRGV